MSSELAIKVEKLSKCYQVYDQPSDRLKQFILPKFRRLLGMHSKQYHREFWALKDISFVVRKGETVGIVGRNGSGKSTLLQLICGTQSSARGLITTAGRIAALLELGSGFNPEFSGRENIYFNAALLGVGNKEIEARIEDIISFADIGDFLDQPIKTYSSGMVARLAFATATNVDPDILIVDEALSVGDEAFQRKCFARIEEMRTRGASILFVSHSIQTIVQLCDKAILIDKGEYLLDGSPKMVVSQYERLANSTPKNSNEIRRSILSMREDRVDENNPAYFNEDVSVGFNEFMGKECAVTNLSGNIAISGEHRDYYDSNLKSQSSVNSAVQGAQINKLSLANISGNEVNNIVLGKRYALLINVTFLSDCRNVSFGMAIKTEKGVVLAGATNVNNNDDKIAFAKLGDEVEVRFEFTCSLLPGAYFIGASVFGSIGNDSLILNRWVDAILFKVQPEPDLLAAGFFDLAPTLSFEYI
jgi:lipopolysaccharide transport system ATP-binding protein